MAPHASPEKNTAAVVAGRESTRHVVVPESTVACSVPPLDAVPIAKHWALLGQVIAESPVTVGGRGSEVNVDVVVRQRSSGDPEELVPMARQEEVLGHVTAAMLLAVLGVSASQMFPLVREAIAAAEEGDPRDPTA